MTGFNEYWKEKAQKIRKSWAAKAKRFADRHEDYKPGHFIKLNPLISWQDMNFRFSEEGLRAALKAEGADLNSFKMEVNRQSISLSP